MNKHYEGVWALAALIAVVAFVVASVAVIAIWWGYALSILWAWFIVPLGASPLSVAHAYGVTLVAGLLMGTRGINAKQNEDKDAWKVQLVIAFLYPLLALGLGYVAVGFI